MADRSMTRRAFLQRGLVALPVAAQASSLADQTAPPGAQLLHGGPYTLDEMVLMAGFCTWGAPPGLDVSRTVAAPNSALGFSLKLSPPGAVIYESYLSRALPPFEALELDLYVESASPDARVTLAFSDMARNRTVAWEQRLADLPPKQWRRITIPRAKMRGPAGRESHWGSLAGFIVDMAGGPAVVYLDNVRITTTGGRSVPVLDAADDGMKFAGRPAAKPQPALPVGDPVFTLGMNRLQSEPLGETPRGLRAAAGADIGIAIGPTSFVMHGYDEVVRRLGELGMPSVHYSQAMWGYNKFLTRRQAWEVDSGGASLNWSNPTSPALGLGYHTAATAAEGATEAARHRIDNIQRAGLATWMIADYVVPYFDFGHAPAMVRAFRDDLSGRDEGLRLRDGQTHKVIHFPEYFRAYNGFYPKPPDVGVTAWDLYERPGPRDQDAAAGRRNILYWHLVAYEWLKLADRAGRYSIGKGGQGLWLMPNNENVWSPDFIHAMRTEGVGGILPEWFGPVVSLVESGYTSAPYLHESATRGGTRVAMDLETGAGGHGPSYWDWRVAYTGAYGLTAMGLTQNVVLDFLDEAPYAVMADRKNLDQFKRLRDGVVKARAFRQAYVEKARSPHFDSAPILSITDRPTGRNSAGSGILFGWGAFYSLGPALSRAHLPFLQRDTLELESVLAKRPVKVLAYTSQVPRVGDFDVLRRWLSAAPGRVLLTHTFIPTRDATEFWHADQGGGLGKVGGGATLGLGAIAATDVKSCTIASAEGVWAKHFAAGTAVALPEPLTACEHGRPVVMTDKGPLVSEATVGQGRVVYLHFSARQPFEPVVSQLSVQAAQAVAELAGIAPICEADRSTPVQVFDVPGGRTVLAWDAPSQDLWKWEYRPGIAPLEYLSPGVDRLVRLPAGGPQLVYDFWADKLATVAPRAGAIELRLVGALCCQWYVGPDTPAFRATLARVQRTRKAVGEYATPDLQVTTLAELPAGVQATKHMAREARLGGGAFPFSEQKAPSGKPYVGAYWVAGASTTFTLDAPRDGAYEVALLYANGGANPQTIGVYLDGSKLGDLRFAPTGRDNEAFDHWTYRVLTLALKAGRHTLAYQADVFDGGPIYLDSLYVWPEGP